MARYQVTCPDGVIRHPDPFTTQKDARTWAYWGHACYGEHVMTVAPEPQEAEVDPWVGRLPKSPRPTNEA